MEIVRKLILILFLFIIIYLWNRFAVPYIINRPEKFHRKYNTENLNKQPIKFYLENKMNIIKYTKWFYWFGFVFLSIMVLFGLIP